MNFGISFSCSWAIQHALRLKPVHVILYLEHLSYNHPHCSYWVGWMCKGLYLLLFSIARKTPHCQPLIYYYTLLLSHLSSLFYATLFCLPCCPITAHCRHRVYMINSPLNACKTPAHFPRIAENRDPPEHRRRSEHKQRKWFCSFTGSRPLYEGL